jgi:hypothetical protein
MVRVRECRQRCSLKALNQLVIGHQFSLVRRTVSFQLPAGRFSSQVASRKSQFARLMRL